MCVSHPFSSGVAEENGINRYINGRGGSLAFQKDSSQHISFQIVLLEHFSGGLWINRLGGENGNAGASSECGSISNEEKVLCNESMDVQSQSRTTFPGAFFGGIAHVLRLCLHWINVRMAIEGNLH